MAGLFGRLSETMALRRTEPPRGTSHDRVVLHHGKIAGVFVTHDEAMRLSAVWACVTVIAKAIASSSWDVFAQAPNGDRTPMEGTTTWRLLNLRPNDEMTPFAWREAMVILALVYGDAYSEIERDLLGRPLKVWPLLTDRCCLERSRDTGELVLEVVNQGGQGVHLPYADVFHLHGPSIDGVAGFDVVALAARTLALSAAAERFGASFYGNGTAFGGILTSEKPINDPQIADLREQVRQRHEGPDRAFSFMVLKGGLKLERQTVDPDKAQFIQGRQNQVEEVCRWFGVPPHKIAHLLHATFSNIEHQGLEFVRDALTPWCERLRQEADWKLIPGSGRFLRTRIDIDWLAEGDAKSKAETDSLLVTAGIMTRNQARRKRAWNSLGPDGDVATVNPGTTALPVALRPPEPSPAPTEDAERRSAADEEEDPS